MQLKQPQLEYRLEGERRRQILDSVLRRHLVGYLTVDDTMRILDTLLHKSMEVRFNDLSRSILPIIARYNSRMLNPLTTLDDKYYAALIGRIDGSYKPYMGELIGVLLEFRRRNNYWEDEIPEPVLQWLDEVRDDVRVVWGGVRECIPKLQYPEIIWDRHGYIIEIVIPECVIF